MAQHVLETAPPRFCLAGHSMGGRVAFEILRTAPERVEKLALIDTAFHPYVPGEESKRQPLVDLARAEGMAAVAAAWLPPMLHPGHMSLMPSLTAMVKRSTPDSFENQQRALLSRDDATGVLGTIRCPTVIICGREDAWCPVSVHEQMAAAIPHAKLIVIEECGHMAPVEQPDAVSAALRDLLSADL